MHLIPSVLPSHSGTYSCVAENVLGRVTDNADADCDDGGDDDDDGMVVVMMMVLMTLVMNDDDAGDDIEKKGTHLILGP